MTTKSCQLISFFLLRWVFDYFSGTEKQQSSLFYAKECLKSKLSSSLGRIPNFFFKSYLILCSRSLISLTWHSSSSSSPSEPSKLCLLIYFSIIWIVFFCWTNFSAFISDYLLYFNLRKFLLNFEELLVSSAVLLYGSSCGKTTCFFFIL